MNNPIISIQIPSNRPDRLNAFFDHLEKFSSNHLAYEVIINLDLDDTVISAFLDNEKSKRPFTIKYVKTFNGGFYNSWKPINDMLPYTNPNAYFLIFLSDEFLVNTPNWDEIICKYIDYYPDQIFRLRASDYRYRNYIDFWECGFAPDSISFTTRKWINIIKDWAPCFSSDAFQQFVAYYLYTSDPFTREQLNRDIPVPFIEFIGQGASIGLTGEKAIERARGGLKAWFKLVSFPMQLEAKRRAMLLKANIANARHNNIYTITEDASSKTINLINPANNSSFAKFSYSLSKYSIILKNLYRTLNYLYYAGGGDGSASNQQSIRWRITYYLSYRFDRLKNLHDKCNHYAGIATSTIRKFLLKA